MSLLRRLGITVYRVQRPTDRPLRFSVFVGRWVDFDWTRIYGVAVGSWFFGGIRGTSASDARVDVSVAYAAGAAAGRAFERAEGAPPSLVVLHEKWCAAKTALNTSLSKEYGGAEEVAAFAAHASARNDLFAWTPTP